MSFKSIATSLLCLLLASCATETTVGPNSPQGSGLFSQRGAKKIALVIGNAKYASQSLKLNSPAKDAEDMEGVLKELGFDVIRRQNLNQQEMTAAFQEFTTQLATAGSKTEPHIALFYYSGHGAEVDGKTYLLATDAPSAISEDGKLLGDQQGVVRLASLYKEIKDLNKAGIKTKNLFVLDNCRNNPMEKHVVMASKDSKGGSRIRNLANALEEISTKGTTVIPKGVVWDDDVVNPEVFQKPSNSFFGYATTREDIAKDGKKGENSPYTKQLLTQMKRHVAVSKLFDEVEKRVKQDTLETTQKTQNPWHEVSDFGDLYLSPPTFHSDSPIF